jgi:hypothetical protein
MDGSPLAAAAVGPDHAAPPLCPCSWPWEELCARVEAGQNAVRSGGPAQDAGRPVALRPRGAPWLATAAGVGCTERALGVWEPELGLRKHEGERTRGLQEPWARSSLEQQDQRQEWLMPWAQREPAPEVLVPQPAVQDETLRPRRTVAERARYPPRAKAAPIPDA